MIFLFVATRNKALVFQRSFESSTQVFEFDRIYRASKPKDVRTEMFEINPFDGSIKKIHPVLKAVDV